MLMNFSLDEDAASRDDNVPFYQHDKAATGSSSTSRSDAR